MHNDSLSLFLVRHAEAASAGGTVRSDAERPLTTRGVEDATVIGRAIAALERPPSLVLCSPLVRAVQTGDLIAKAFGPAPPCSVSPFLQPGFVHKDLLEELLTLHRAGQQSIVAVSHQPDVGNFISYLIAGTAPASVAIPPGTVARISLRTTGGRPEGLLQWLLSPAAARALFSTTAQKTGQP